MRGAMMVVFLMFAAGGCNAPTIKPITPRLSASEQSEADREWHNMFTPPDRVEREPLMGALVFFEMYQHGVDRADYHAEKMVDDKRVVIDMHFQRERPQEDGIYVSVFGPEGQILRSERFSREEIEKLETDATFSGLASASQPSTPAEQAAKAERKRRYMAILAATQPAGWKPPETESATRP